VNALCTHLSAWVLSKVRRANPSDLPFCHLAKLYIEINDDLQLVYKNLFTKGQ